MSKNPIPPNSIAQATGHSFSGSLNPALFNRRPPTPVMKNAVKILNA
jgi:hypothetical protein